MKKIKLLSNLKYIRVQIAAYYLMASILIIGIMGMVLYYSLTNIMLDDALESTKYSVEKSGGAIELYVEKLKAISHIIATDQEVITYLQHQDEAARASAHDLIRNVMSTDENLITGILVSKTGKILSTDTTLDMSMSSDMMGESWYIDVMEKGSMPVLTSARRQAFSMDKSQWVISIGREVVDAQGNHIGLLILDFSYEVIERFLSSLNLGTEGFAYLLSDHGELVYHDDASYFESEDKLKTLVEIQKMPTGFDQGMGKLTHQIGIKGTTWNLVGVSSLDHLAVARRQLFEVIALVAILLVFIAIGSGVLIASRISRPIKALEDAMNRFSKGLTEVATIPNSCYEVESLWLHFNEMRVQIDALLAGIKEKENYLRKSELNALYSQINPHFLYNTLDTIIWMAEFKESEKVISITKALAQFFRISLSQGDALIPLSSEIEHIRQYLFIQEQRYGDQLSYEINVPNTLLSVQVPKIILQPLVENAIYHGIKPLGRPGHLTVTADVKYAEESTEPDVLILTVSDDGVGFDMNEKKAYESQTRLGGVGVDNVNRRIALTYGKSYGVSILTYPGSGTTVSVKLPIDHPKMESE